MNPCVDNRTHLNIPVSHFQPLFSWDESRLRCLAQKAVTAAITIGIKLEDDDNETYLKEAESKGAQVDKAGRVVRFSAAIMDRVLDRLRATATIATPRRALNIQPGPPEGAIVGNGANLLFDWDAWDVRAPAVRDLVRLAQWASGCPDVAGLYAPVMLKDIDQRLEPLFNYALTVRHCRKPVCHEQPTMPIHVKYLRAMAALVEQARGYRQAMLEYEYINSPFRLGRRSIETMLARVDLGACSAMGIGSMAVSGLNAPVTVAGTVVTALAEILAGLALFHVLRPDYGLKSNVCTGAMDMRTGRVSFANIRAHLQNLAAWDLIARGIGADSACLTWYRDANEPGMQALYEYGLNRALFSTVLHRASPEIGGLACGNIFSPEQAVMDVEADREFAELEHGFCASDEAVGFDDILAAGFDPSVHLTTEHTMRWMNPSLSFSAFLPRGQAGGARHNRECDQTRELMESARERVCRDTNAGARADPDETLSNALYEHVRRAADELGVEAPAWPVKEGAME